MVSLGNSDRGTLVSLLKERSLQLGDFTLSSGKKSKYYVDARLTTMSADGLEVIGTLGVAMISSARWHPSAVGGSRSVPILWPMPYRRQAGAHHLSWTLSPSGSNPRGMAPAGGLRVVSLKEIMWLSSRT